MRTERGVTIALISKRALVTILIIAAIAIGGLFTLQNSRTGESNGAPQKNCGTLENDDTALVKTGRGEDLYLVEIEKNSDAGEVSEIREMAGWAGTLHGSLLPVRMEAEQAESLKELPFVKKIETYPVEQKVAGELRAPSGEAGSGGAGNVAGQTAVLEAVVTLVTDNDKKTAVQLVEKLGGTVTSGAGEPGRYLRVEIPADVLDKLSASPVVLYIEQYERPELLNDRAKDIVAARPLAVPNFITGAALNGEGQILGLADSGLDTGLPDNLHPDLENPAGKKPKVIMLKSWAGVEIPADTAGHGTHMAGTMVGNGKASGGGHSGLAPEASLYFQGIVDEEDNLAPPLDLQHLLQPAYRAGVRVHVNGWGRKKNTYNSPAVQIDDFVFNHPDFLAVFAAGNSGSRAGSLTSEANSKNALTVGASICPRPVFDNVTGDTTTVAGFSSRGPAEDGRIKPELVAPGTNIISAASRVVQKENLPGRPEYISKQGSSMASAVTGGAAALLRQYMQENAGMQEPSAALLKAALINGAQRLEGASGATGFGLLDIGGTVMALENRLFELVDDKEGISTRGNKTYEKIVAHGGAPFKATLAWTDPAAVPGSRLALVNDLDLEVIAPDGTKYYGNDFSYKGLRDGRNNVEQVYIPDSEPGTYKMIVRGKSVMEDASRGQGVRQDYALVFGRSPARHIVSDSTGDDIILAGGDRLSKSEQFSVMVNNELMPGEKVPPTGAQLYLTGSSDDPRQTYAVARTERVNGVKALEVNNETVLMRVNPAYREGGYAVDSRAGDALILNGRPVENGHTIPPGVSLTSYVNPRTQTIWRAEITSREETGIFAAIDLENRQVKLLDHDKTYSLAEQASVSFTDIVVDGAAADLPFGASTSAGLENLLPGMPLHIALGSNDKVYHLSVKRYMVTGRVTGVEPGKGTLALSSGGEYRLTEGVKITRDGVPAGLKDLQEGDLAMLDLIPDSAQVLGLTIYSDVICGRVIYTENNALYLMDNNGFDMLKFHPGIQVFRWGMLSGTSILNPGQWVRVVKEPVSGAVWRVDIAEFAGRAESVFQSFFPGTNIIKTDGGDLYRLSSASEITKNGIPVKAKDLIPGEPVTVTALYGPGGEKIVAVLKAETRPGVKTPGLKVKSTIPFEDFSMVTGNTTASRLYAWYPGGNCDELQLTKSGEFYYPVQADKAGDIRLVAVNSSTGGVTGLNLSLSRRQKGFPDVDGHWAEIDIRHLVSRGMLHGYPQGDFGPNKDITRVEFTVMLARLMGNGGAVLKPPYNDAENIPNWAQNPVALAHNRGLAKGYEDNTFRPYNFITREEAACLLVRAYGILRGIPEPPGESPPYADQEAISGWARDKVNKARLLELFTGRAENRFDPKVNITRAETAAVLNRLLVALTEEE
ncbi:MAG: S8 family serine peptidase [Firmicutes bacterium]|nr:S8 family serine peptidase [Bacillota bacterium]